MKIRKIIRKRIRHNKDGIQVAGDINATIAANVNEGDSRTRVSSHQRIVQRSGNAKKAEDEKGGD
jgi:hypothetical protein